VSPYSFRSPRISMAGVLKSRTARRAPSGAAGSMAYAAGVGERPRERGGYVSIGGSKNTFGCGRGR
jgi:hypothetical protein